MKKSAHTNKNTATGLYAATLAVLLAICPLVAAFAPRALGFIPAVVGLVAFMAYHPLFKSWPPRRTALWGWMAAIPALAALSYFWALDPAMVIERSLKILPLFLGGFLLICIDFQGVKGIFGRIFPPVYFAAVAFCVFELYTGGMVYKHLHSWPDPTKMAGDGGLNLSLYNRAVVFLTLSFWPAFAALRAWENPQKTKIFQLISALTLIAALLLKTESQSAQLAFMASAFVYFIAPLGQTWFWYVGAAGILVVLWGVPWVMPFLFKTLPAHLEGVGWFQNGYAPNRLEIWDFVARRIAENPLYGFGLEATRATFDFDTQRIFHKDKTVLHPHNFVLQVWIEFGAIGIALLSGFFLWLLTTFRAQTAPVARLYLATFISILAVAFTGYGMWQGWWIGALFLLAAFCRIIGEKQL